MERLEAIVKTIIPSGDDMFLPQDKVIILAANQRINKLSDIIRG